MRYCQANQIEALIAATPDGEVCKLSQKEYYLERRVEILGRSNVTLDGDGAEIICKYVSSAPYTASADAFLIEDCQGVEIKNITIACDVAPNVTAYVEETDAKTGLLTLKVDDEFPMNGNEVLMSLISANSNGAFDYRTHHYHTNPVTTVTTLIQGEILCANSFVSAPYDYLGGNRFRVQLKPLEIDKLNAGDRICIRYTMYGPAAIALRNSDDTTLKNITIHSAAGMGVNGALPL